MATIMIVPAGLYQIPAIIKAKKMSFRVITADYLHDNPGHKYADRSLFVNITEKDSILSLAQEEQIDAIFTMASDIAVETVGYVAQKMDLIESIPYDSIRTICLKHKFREFQKINGFNYPQFQAVDTFSSFELAVREIGLPVIIKPSDSSGSKGVFCLAHGTYKENDLEDIFTKSQLFSRNKIVCVEKFIEGLEIGGDALIFDGQIIFCQLTNKYNTPAPNFVPIGHSIPSRLDIALQTKIKSTLQKAVKALGVKNGGLNFDVMVASDVITILEMSPRLGGNCIPSIMRYGTGIDTVEAALLMSYGVKPLICAHKTKPVGVRILRSEKDGFLAYHSSIEQIQEKHASILELEIDMALGTSVKRFTQGAFRIGHVICQAESVEALEQELDLVEKDLNITVDNIT